MSVFIELNKNASLEILVENGKRHNIKSLEKWSRAISV